MPELPEVETVARGLQTLLPGRTIRRAALTAADLYRAGSERMRRLAGTRIDRVERIGKAILFRLSVPPGGGVDAAAEKALVVHLGMTGRFLFKGDATLTPGQRVGHHDADGTAAVPPHRHGRFVFADGSELWYVDPRRFGYFYLAAPEGLRAALNMGSDPFELRPRALAELLERRTAPIKSVLLNQKVVAGLGNIYVDEILFACGIHPLTPSRRVSGRSAEILNASRRILRRAIRYQGTTLRDYRTAEGETGRYQLRLDVYGRQSEGCHSCGGEIRRVVVSARSTHFCPHCQPRRRAAAPRR